MRRLRWGLFTLACVPTLALATPEGASADKRMLLFRTAIGRANCPQARDVAQSMLIDFPEDAGVRLLIAQVLACEGKWVEAYTPMMAAKAAGLEVAEVAAKILANVAIVEVTVTVDGAVATENELEPELASVATLPILLSPGTFRFVLGAGALQTKAPLTLQLPPKSGRLERGPAVEVGCARVGELCRATLALERVPTVALRRPEGLDGRIVLRLAEDDREVMAETPIVLPAGKVTFVASWLAPGTWDTGVTKSTASVRWQQEMGPSSSIQPPWAFALRGTDDRLLLARLVAGDAPRVVLDGESLVVDGVKVRLRGAVERGDKGPQDVTVDIADKVADFRRARRNPSIWTWGGGALTAASVGSLVYARSAASTFAEQARSYDGLNDGDAYRADVMTVNQATLMANLSLGSAALAAGACAYGVVRGMKLPDGIDINVSTKEGE